MATLRRFAFFEREALRAPALACLDITAGTSGRGLVVLGDGEGHVILVGRDFSGRAFRAYKHRVNAVALLKGSDILVTLGDAADARPASVRNASRSAALAARDKLRRDRDKEKATSAAAAGGGAGATAGGAKAGRKGSTAGSDRDSDADGGSDDDADGDKPSSSSSKTEPDADLGYVLGLGVPLEYGVSTSSLAGGGAGGGPAPDDPSFCTATLKVWRLDRRDPRTGAPECVRTAKVFTPASRQPEKTVTSLAVNEELTQIAIGCADGTLLLLRSEWTRERGSAATIKYQILQEAEKATPSAAASSAASGGSSGPLTCSSPDAVTFLSFCTYPDPHTPPPQQAQAQQAAAAGEGEGDKDGEGMDKPESTTAAAASSSGFLGRGGGGKGKAGGSGGLALTSSSSSSSSSSGGMPVLFHVSPHRIRSWFPSSDVRPPGLGRGWSAGEASILLDDTGAEAGCACVSDSGELVTGNDNGVFFYSCEDRRAAYPFLGRKSRIVSFRSHHLVVATEEEAAPVGGGGGPGSGYAIRGAAPPSSTPAGLGPSVPGRLTLTIYDLRSKFIAFSMSLAPPQPAGAGAAVVGRLGAMGAVGGSGSGGSGSAGGSGLGGAQTARLLLCEWGLVFAVVATTGGEAAAAAISSSSSSSSATSASSSSSSSGLGLTVFQLSEKDTGSKVDTLCALQLYDVAATVASHSNYGADGLKDIYRKHGDYLYSKGEWEGAVAQYVRTLGNLEPSYVIRRFLDSQRIPHLAVYLEALHASGKATADHTTLLLYCYTKLRASHKLKAFIRGELAAAGSGPAAAAAASSSSGGGAGTSSLSFDVRTVISVLRDLSSIDPDCLSQALYLAEAHGEHEKVVGLLVEMAQGAQAAATSTAAAVAASGAAEAAGGGVAVVTSSSAGGAVTPPGSYVDAALGYIRRLPFPEAEAFARRYGRSLMSFRPEAVTELLVDLCAGYNQVGGNSGSGGQPAQQSGAEGGGRTRTRTDRPESFLPLFVDHPSSLRSFAWALTAKAASRVIPPLSRVMWHSLLEVALATQQQQQQQQGASSSASSPDVSGASGGNGYIDILNGILRDPSADYDPHYALLLCQRAGYKQGCLHLYERLRRYPLVLQHYMETADTARASGRLGEAKASRRELLRKAKAFSDPSVALSGEPDPAPTIWTAVLQYLTRTYSPPGPAALVPPQPGPDGVPLPPLDDSEQLLTDALRHVERSAVLHPLAVVQLLAGPPGAVPFGLVREYLIRRLTSDRDKVAEDARVVESLRGDAVAMLNESHRLATQPTVFQSRRCRACGGELDLPSLHFLCGGLAGEEHSFHAHCVSDNAALLAAAASGGTSGGGSDDAEAEEALASLACPLCAGEQRQVREFKASLGLSGGRTSEAFFHELSASSDGFAKAAEYLSKGVFDTATPPA